MLGCDSPTEGTTTAPFDDSVLVGRWAFLFHNKTNIETGIIETTVVYKFPEHGICPPFFDFNSDSTRYRGMTNGFFVSSDSMYCDLTIADYDTLEVGKWIADEYQLSYLTEQDSLLDTYDYLLNADTLRVTGNSVVDTLYIYLYCLIKVEMEIVG